MSQGSPVITCRIPQATIDKIAGEIDRINRRRMDSPFTLRSFIMSAIFDKLAHIERGRAKHSRRELDLEAGLTIANVTLTLAENPIADLPSVTSPEED